MLLSSRISCALLGLTSIALTAAAQPTLSLPNLQVRTVAGGLSSPTAIAFLKNNGYLVTEKNTGKVKWFREGELQGEVLDLAVNFASERGLLGIAVHPTFPLNPSVYLFWTCVATAEVPQWSPGQAPPAFIQSQQTCDNANMSGSDSNEILRVPVLGNRVDRFRWDADAERLVFEQNLISLRAFQNDGVPTPAAQGDEGQPPRGNHNGGVIRFGHDGKLYIFFGDQGRRGQLQNLPAGPVPGMDDDQFGGAEPDDDHLSGVVLRLNPDGTPPIDNPFYYLGSSVGGSVGQSLQKIYAYGFRNSFGMAFEPHSGDLWISEHGDDSFDEINRVTRGMNGGWIQLAGPSIRIQDFKSIENFFYRAPETSPSLQQWRWPPSLIADTASDGQSRLVMYPGASYSDPAFSWKWATLPVSMAFIEGNRLGDSLQGNLLVNLVGDPAGPGHLLRFRTTSDLSRLHFDDPRLEDMVADNNSKYDLTESESLIIGTGWGLATDMRMSPEGTLYVVSFTHGEIYEIHPAEQSDEDDGNVNGGAPLSAQLTGSAEIPGPGDPDGAGTVRLAINSGLRTVCFELTATNIAPATAAHIHRGSISEAGPVVVPLTAPTNGSSQGCAPITRDLAKAIRKDPHLYYVNVHNAVYPAGAIRGQLSKP